MIYGPYPGVVDSVHDGDTINIKLDLGFDLTVYTRARVFGINAPELSTPAGQVAKTFAQSLLPVGAVVKVTSHGWDKYGGRTDADIWIVSPVVPGASGERDFATLMLSSGNAVPYKG